MKKITQTLILSLLFIGISCSSDDSTTNDNVTPPSENPPTDEPAPSDPIVGTWNIDKTKYYKESEFVIESEGACSTIKDYWVIEQNNVFSSTYHYSDCESRMYEDIGTWSKENGTYAIIFDGSPFEILEITSSKIILSYNGVGTYYDNNDNAYPFDYYTIELKK